MVFAANLLPESERRSQVVRRHSWGQRAVTPQAHVEGLLCKQRLDERQVQTPHAPTIQHQDLVARTQTCEHTCTRFRKATLIAYDGVIGDFNRICVIFKEAGTFIESQSIRKHLADKDPAVFLAVCVSSYCKTWRRKKNQ